MRLYIKQRVFSWTDTYDVYDETGEARYFVQAEFLTWGHQIHVYDKRTNREVGSIHQRLFSFTPTFEVVIGGRVMGTVRKSITFFVPRYEVDYRGWDVEGDVFGWDYDVVGRGGKVMSISKEFFSWGDAYSLEYRDPANEIPGLLLVIAIDAANCKD